MPSASSGPAEPWTLQQVMDFMFHEPTAEDSRVGWCISCHNGGDSEPPNIPRDGQAFLAFMTTYTAPECHDYKFVEPGDPDASALSAALEMRCNSPEFKMPTDEFGPSAEDIQGVRSWIAAGATE